MNLNTLQNGNYTFNSEFYNREDEIIELQVQIEKILECINNTCNIENLGDRTKTSTDHESTLIELSKLSKVLKVLTDNFDSKITSLKEEYV